MDGSGGAFIDRAEDARKQEITEQYLNFLDNQVPSKKSGSSEVTVFLGRHPWVSSKNCQDDERRRKSSDHQPR